MGDKWKKTSVIIDQYHKKIVLKPLIFRNLGHSSEMRNDALMHHEGLKG